MSRGGNGSVPEPEPPAVDAARSRRRGAIATGAAVLALGGAIAAVIIRAASIGRREDR
ncbi:MAG TPA: hypothetical protein PKD59_06275 [Miltoncostaeaceae bacterium]|nr:hypothetical protein [Miltoncostaeaceae bacterium]